MPKTRTILAFLIVAILSFGVARVRGASQAGASSYAAATFYVDGVKQSVTVNLPAAAVDHLQGPVLVSVVPPSGHAVSFGETSGTFKLAISLDEANADGNSVVATAVVRADETIGVRVALSDDSGASRTFAGTSAAPIHARLPFHGSALAAHAP
jgi:hypothetical protein